jgi:hypothetical protein|tara:strand:- start:1096 stop:1293 length:198 start_codon:yes stop_codon:yes gene_type:complete
MDEKIDRFIDLIQVEVHEDIKQHVFENNSKFVMKHLEKPVTDYVVAMVIDNLLSKSILHLEEIKQ